MCALYTKKIYKNSWEIFHPVICLWYPYLRINDIYEKHEKNFIKKYFVRFIVEEVEQVEGKIKLDHVLV